MSENQTSGPAKQSWWPEWLKFNTPFEQWTRVINPIYVAYMAANALVYIYAGFVTGDSYAFEAAFGYGMTAGLFFVWTDGMRSYRKLSNMFWHLIEEYKDENASLRNKLADVSAKLMVAERGSPQGVSGASSE